MVEFKLCVKDTDYGEIAERLLPLVLEKSVAKKPGSKLYDLLTKLQLLPAGFLKSALKRLDQDTKDELAVFLLNENKAQILQQVDTFAKENGVAMQITSLEIRQVP